MCRPTSSSTFKQRSIVHSLELLLLVNERNSETTRIPALALPLRAEKEKVAGRSELGQTHLEEQNNTESRGHWKDTPEI